MNVEEVSTRTGYRRYDHLERLGHRNVAGIEYGKVHVFPKLDGTNASVWSFEGNICAGSRNRQLSLDADNAGFLAWVLGEDPTATCLRGLCGLKPNWIIYGEWMVPHTLKTYRQEVWRRFWVFDVYDRDTHTYLPYEVYAPTLKAGGLDVIEPLCTIQDPSVDQLKLQVETNTYLIADGAGLGEGVVLKNYAWRTAGAPWAKVVRNVFKEEAARAFGHAEKSGEFQVEVAIVEEFVTPHLVGKTRAKVLLDLANELGTDTTDPNWQQTLAMSCRGRIIPQLLGRVFHDLIEEEMWAILKKHMKSSPSIDFKKLQARVILQVKALSQDLF
jgi:hypothetical protein